MTEGHTSGSIQVCAGCAQKLGTIRVLEAEVARLRKFAHDVISLDWGGAEVHVDVVQQAALTAGLIRLAPGGYDPEKHGESDYCDPGDDYYEFTDALRPEDIAKEAQK